MPTEFFYAVVVPDDNHRASIKKLQEGETLGDRDSGRFSTWREAYDYLIGYHQREIASWERFCQLRREHIAKMTADVEMYEKALISAHQKFLREVEALEEPSSDPTFC